MSIETPCIAVCMIDPKTSLCLGWGRTLPEIARWHRMEGAERLAGMGLLASRLAGGGGGGFCVDAPARIAQGGGGAGPADDGGEPKLGLKKQRKTGIRS